MCYQICLYIYSIVLSCFFFLGNLSKLLATAHIPYFLNVYGNFLQLMLFTGTGHDNSLNSMFDVQRVNVLKKSYSSWFEFC